MIEVANFTKLYEAVGGNPASIAVDSLSFSVQPGQVLGLVGRNGAGKTTTLRAIAGIIPKTQGVLTVGGFDLDQQPLMVKRNAAYVPDDPQLFEDLTVEQHLLFQASVYEIAEPGPTIDSLLKQFELNTKRHARADSLSRGMRQKLAICCAYLQSPSALLLDEPMTGLDPQAIRALKDSVQEKAAAGAAVIISSHLLAMVEDICSHVMVLDRGRKRFLGTVEALAARFQTSPLQSTSLEDAFLLALDRLDDSIAEEISGNVDGAIEPATERVGS